MFRSQQEIYDLIKSKGYPDDMFLVRYSKTELPAHFSVKGYNLDRAEIALMYFSWFDIFAAWSLQYHRDGPYTLSGNLQVREMKSDSLPLAEYKSIHNEFEVEKVVYFQGDDLLTFLEKSSHIMFPNEGDGFKKDRVRQGQRVIQARKKDSVTQWRRDKRFRTAVLNAYNSQCAICRCRMQEVLQAAHEKHYEPPNTAYDDPAHGICLCANHHLMYDSDVIDIDIAQGTMSINKHQTEVEASEWFKAFREKYHFKLVDRKEK